MMQLPRFVMVSDRFLVSLRFSFHKENCFFNYENEEDKMSVCEENVLKKCLPFQFTRIDWVHVFYLTYFCFFMSSLHNSNVKL